MPYKHLVVLGLSAVLSIKAEQNGSAAKPAATQMVMTKDPITGKLRPATREEQAELQKQTEERAKAKAKATPAGASKWKVIQGPGGAEGLVLDEDVTVYSVATKSSDGKLTTREVTGKSAAAKTVQAPVKKKTETGNEK